MTLRLKPRAVALLIAALILIVFVGANAHLIVVATSSQPDCVQHTEALFDGVVHRAARPSC